MAIYHFSTKILSRKTGRTVRSSAAYRTQLPLLRQEECSFLHSGVPVSCRVHALIVGPPEVPKWLYFECFLVSDVRRPWEALGRPNERAK
jgi:hypothetical protein